MPSVVVDTNILVRALLSPDGSDALILRLAFDRKVTLLYSNGILIELLRVLKYSRMKKFGVAEEEIEAFVRAITTHGKAIVPKEIHLCRDEDDNEILGVSLASGQDRTYIITADGDLLVLAGSVDGVTILTPQEFLKSMPLGAKIR
ncbi:MAG: putative toxin-antitoxin system toxin component, PIN family [Patescibacteria group bacterium]